MCDNDSFDSNMRTELLYLHQKSTQSGKLESPTDKLKEIKLEEKKDKTEVKDLSNILGK